MTPPSRAPCGALAGAAAWEIGDTLPKRPASHPIGTGETQGRATEVAPTTKECMPEVTSGPPRWR